MQFSINTPKKAVFEAIAAEMKKKGFRNIKQDETRPWGGFFVLDELQTPEFIAHFFPQLNDQSFALNQKLSPKILVVAPEKRLSWQYHFRRAEIWKVIGGNAGVVISDTDEETALKHLPLGSIISLKEGERHRLVGLNEWGIVAEIWQHTDANHPSDEEDIVRLQDDFGR